MDFRESQEYLLSLGFELSVKKFGLENSLALFEALDHPEKKYLKVQVAGTNGKGSTCAFLESMALAAGYKVGLNTSPHLVSITERVRVNGRDISEIEFARYATIVRGKGEELVANETLKALPTYFEHVTAIALLAFADAGVDLAILETGLGGRFDATTAARSEVAVLTPIDLDHMKTLGATVALIASEKAAIIREDTLVVVSAQIPEAREVIDARCAEKDVGYVNADEIKAIEHGEFVDFVSSKAEFADIRLGLKGRHQISNARTAIAVAEALAEKGIEIAKDAISRGLENASHRGRLEYRDGFLFDGAHNASGAAVLREYLDENVNEPITMMFAAMAGKDLGEISKILFPKAENLIFVKPANPRAMETSELLEFVPGDFPEEKVFAPESVAEAVDMARRLAGDGLILVTGSLYLIGEVQAVLGRREVAVRRKS
jgi:dihydrofolate synthase/folylpolyglutamate synthase